MKRLGLLLLLFTLLWAPPASADWRWAPHKAQKQKVTYTCNTYKCLRQMYVKERKKLKARIERHDRRRLKEWKKWTKIYIPDCTWYGESGTGPRYSPIRYLTWNSTGSGARGKYQFMPGTYSANARYHDWSPLDQEIAARREYWKHGIWPWTNCHG